MTSYKASAPSEGETAGALKPPFERYSEADVADRHGHIFTAENREIADALFAALSTPPTDTVAVPRETLRQVIYWLKNSSLQPHPNAVGSGEADPNEAPLKLAAEIYRLLQGENDARARAVAAGKEQP